MILYLFNYKVARKGNILWKLTIVNYFNFCIFFNDFLFCDLSLLTCPVLSGRSGYIVKLLGCVVSHSEKNPQKTNAWNFSSTLSYYLFRTNTFAGHVIAFLVTTVCATFLRTVNAIKRFSTIYIHKYKFKKNPYIFK